MNVFISHGSYDIWIARQVARCIEDAGATTFLDANDIETGDEFKSLIRQQIIRSDELVALLTPFSRNRAWLWTEIGVAWGYGKRISAFLYGMTLADMDSEAGGGRSILEGRHVRELNAFDAYVDELRKRIGDEK